MSRSVEVPRKEGGISPPLMKAADLVPPSLLRVCGETEEVVSSLRARASSVTDHGVHLRPRNGLMVGLVRN